MGHYNDIHGLASFYPDDDDNTIRIPGDNISGAEVMERIKEKWPDEPFDRFWISAEYVQTSSFGDNLYDRQDYDTFIVIRRQKELSPYTQETHVTRTQFFVNMGRNCRLLSMSPMAAEQTVLNFLHANEPEDCDNFFQGYHYGDNPELTNLPRWEDVIGTDAEREWNITDEVLQSRYPFMSDTN